MSPSSRFLICFVLSVLPGFAAETDPAVLERQRAEIDRKFNRESQKVDQSHEQALIPINAKRRELSAKIDRNRTGVLNLAAYLASDGASGIDWDKIEQARLEELEGQNVIDRQLVSRAEEATQARRDDIERRRVLELARFDANAIPDDEDAAKRRAAATRRADVGSKWQQKIDALNQEGQRAEHQLLFDRASEINKLETKIFITEQKAAFAAMQKMREQSKAGQTPNMLAMSLPINEATADLRAKRDDLRNSLETAREELRAKFNVRRTDLENDRDDELAQIEG